MKVEITFDEEDNDYAVIKLDGQSIRVTKNTMDCSHTPEGSAGREICSQLFDAVSNILIIRELMERAGTWEKLQEYQIDLIEEHAY